jgi:phosphoribosylglycinamide formyltransferase-1
VKFLPELRKKGLAESFSAADASSSLHEWRNRFGEEVIKTIRILPSVDIVIMAGYMLILGDPELHELNLVNIHPALPWGPQGTWQEVIHQLIAERASEQGIMIHLVTKELDRGPVISFCRFPIHGPDYENLWAKWHAEISPDSTREQRENHPLFRKIRADGEIRELPLLRGAIRELAFGKIIIKDRVIYVDGAPLAQGVDLTEFIESTV